jgi:hypothetical protein
MSYILIPNASHIVQSLWHQRKVKLRKRDIEVNFYDQAYNFTCSTVLPGKPTVTQQGKQDRQCM